MIKTILANNKFKLLYNFVLGFPAMNNLNSTNQMRRDNTRQHNGNLNNDDWNEMMFNSSKSLSSRRSGIGLATDCLRY